MLGDLAATGRLALIARVPATFKVGDRLHLARARTASNLPEGEASREASIRERRVSASEMAESGLVKARRARALERLLRAFTLGIYIGCPTVAKEQFSSYP